VEGTVARGLAVDLDLEAVVRLHDKSVQARRLDDARHRGVLEVLLLVLASFGVLVSEDEVNLVLLDHVICQMWSNAYLVGGTALVGSKHDNVGRSVGELLSVKCLVVLKQLHVRTTALQAVCRYVSTPVITELRAQMTYPGA
jgi:hypothetical protein